MKHDTPSQRLIAHRGLSKTYPENTLPALQAACAQGARCIEFDVQFTADDVPVLLHDASLERTCGVAGNVNDITAVDLRALTAGEPARFGDTFKEVRVPLFAEAVAFVRSVPETTCFVDVKDDAVNKLGPEVVLASLLQDIPGDASPFVLTSARIDLLQLAAQRGLTTALVIEQLNETVAGTVEDIAAEFVFCHMKRVDESGGVLTKRNWQWAIYGVETGFDADRLIARGAHFIETRSFDVLHRHLSNGRRSDIDTTSA